jgi:hypothetical protein
LVIKTPDGYCIASTIRSNYGSVETPSKLSHGRGNSHSNSESIPDRGSRLPAVTVSLFCSFCLQKTSDPFLLGRDFDYLLLCLDGEHRRIGPFDDARTSFKTPKSLCI